MKKVSLVLVAMLFATVLAAWHPASVSAYSYYTDFSNSSDLNWWNISNPDPTDIKIFISNGQLVIKGSAVYKTAIVSSPAIETGRMAEAEFRVNATNPSSGGWYNKWGLMDGSGNAIVTFTVHSSSFTLAAGGATKTLNLSTALSKSNYKFVLTQKQVQVYINNELVDTVNESLTSFRIFFESKGNGGGGTIWVDWVNISAAPTLYLHIRNGLSGASLSGVTLKVDNTTYTVSDGDTITLSSGTHVFEVSKSGYNAGKATLDIEHDTNISIIMYPTTYPSPSEIVIGGAGSSSSIASSGSSSSWNWPSASGDMSFIAAFIAMIVIGAVLIPLQRYDPDGTATKYALLLIAVAVIAVVAGIVMKWI